MQKINSSHIKVQFECVKNCSACCELSGGFVFLSADEAISIAKYLELDQDLFLKWFTIEAEDQFVLRDGENEHCVFLEDGICLIYEVRPKQCRTYPFWPENMKTKAHWNLTKKMCPGIGQGRLFSKEEIAAILNGKDLDSER